MNSKRSIYPNRNRFEYDRMTPAEFTEALDRLGWKYGTFASLFGSTIKRAHDYATGDAVIPMWVPVALHVMETVPGALGAARGEIDRRMARDTLHEKHMERNSA